MRRSAFGSTTGSYRPKFKRKCRDAGPYSPRKRSANWRTLRNTGANSCACSDSASTASTTRRTSTRASFQVERGSEGSWGGHAARPPIKGKFDDRQVVVTVLSRLCFPLWFLSATRCDLLGALERGARHPARDVGLERRARRHLLNSRTAKFRPAPIAISAAEKFSPRSQGPFSRAASSTSKTALRVAPASGNRIHRDLGRNLHHRRLDTARREEQPIQELRAQRVTQSSWSTMGP